MCIATLVVLLLASLPADEFQRYFRSELYHTTLIVDTSVLTKWAIRLRESSRISLRESVATTVAIVETLVTEGLSAFLPPGR